MFREKGYTTYTPDLPGFGSAEPPIKPWLVDDYVEWLKNYILSLPVPYLTPPAGGFGAGSKDKQKVILVTQSFGGRVAIKFAVKYPQYVEKLVMCGVPGIKERLSWRRWMLKLAIRIGKWWLKGATWELWVPWIVRKYIERKLSQLDFFRAQGVMRATFTNVVNEDLRPNLKKITIPTLLVWGENDEFVSLEAAHIMQREIPNAKLVVIPNTKHKVYYTHPDLVVQHIFDFLK